jgi:hypothetical protein
MPDREFSRKSLMRVFRSVLWLGSVLLAFQLGSLGGVDVPRLAEAGNLEDATVEHYRSVERTQEQFLRVMVEIERHLEESKKCLCRGD